MPRSNATIWTMIFGTIIFVATLYAWLYAEQHSIDSSVLWPVAVPVITALFVGQQLGAIGKAANQAVVQTNGTLEARVEKVVIQALANRDAIRTFSQINPTTVTTTTATTEHNDNPNQ